MQILIPSCPPTFEACWTFTKKYMLIDMQIPDNDVHETYSCLDSDMGCNLNVVACGDFDAHVGQLADINIIASSVITDRLTEMDYLLGVSDSYRMGGYVLNTLIPNTFWMTMLTFRRHQWRH